MPWIIPLATAAYGVYQSASAGAKRKKAEAALEKQVNDAKPDSSILDYYNKALSKYSPNPYQSVGYNQQSNQIQRNLSTGLNSAQDRRLGLGALGSLVQQANDSSAKAAANADAQGRQDLSTLGNAAQRLSAEEKRIFDMKYNMNAAKGAAYADTQNTGMRNVFNGLNSAFSELRGNNDEGWGDSVNKWGRETRRVNGIDFTKRKYDRANRTFQYGYSGGVY